MTVHAHGMIHPMQIMQWQLLVMIMMEHLKARIKSVIVNQTIPKCGTVDVQLDMSLLQRNKECVQSISALQVHRTSEVSHSGRFRTLMEQAGEMVGLDTLKQPMTIMDHAT